MKLRFMVIFSLLCALLFYINCSYAYTFDDFIYFVDSIKDDATQFNRSTAAVLNYQNAIKSKIGSRTYNTYVVKANNDGGYTSVYASNSDITIRNLSSNILQFSQNYIFDEYSVSYSNGSISVFTGQRISSLDINNYYGLIVTSNDWTDFGNGFFNNKYVEPYYGPEFVPVNSSDITVYYNGSILDIAKRLDFGYVFPKSSSLGYLTNYDNNIQGIQGFFGPVVYFSGDEGAITDGTQATFKYDLYSGTFTNGLLFDINTGEIRVDSSRLIENQCYFLSISYQQDFKGDWVYLSPDVSYFALKFSAAPITSGEAISPYLDSTVDIGLINSVNDILNNNPNKDYYYNNGFNFSGDFWDPSGDVFGIQYRQYDGFGLHSFIKSVFNSFIQILSNFNDISVNVGILGTWNSADFVIPQNSFTPLISLISNGLLCLYAGFALYRFFNLITTFDLDTLTESSDVMNWF